MKYPYILIAILATIAQLANAQLLYDHRLFALSYENTTDMSGYIHYVDYVNGGPVSVIDSNLYRDFHILGNKLLASGNGCSVYQVPPNGAPGLTLLQSIPIDASRGFITPSGLIFLCPDPPYFRWNPNIGQQQSLDTSAVPQGFTDAMVNNSRLYVLYPDELRIINLNNWPFTVTTLPTPKPFPFGGVNTWLLSLRDDNNDEHIYIDIEYYTALERVSLIELDVTTNTFDSIFHYNIFSNYYRPLAADGLLYMMNFDTHYDPIADTVIFTTRPSIPFYLTVGYSSPMNYYLLYRPDVQRVYFADWSGSLYDSTALNCDARKFHYWYDVIGGNEEPTTAFPFRITPILNGWEGFSRDTELTIKDIRMLDVSGRLIPTRSEVHRGSFKIQHPDLQGVYVIIIDTDKGRYTKKLLTPGAQ